MVGMYTAPEAAMESWKTLMDKKKAEAEGIKEDVEEKTKLKLRQLGTKKPEADPEITRRIKEASGAIKSLRDMAAEDDG